MTATVPLKPVLIPGKSFESSAIDKSAPRRVFADTDLQAHIDRAIAGLPPEKTGVIVGYADRNGAQLALVVKKEFDAGRLEWTVSLSTPWANAPANLEASTAARFSWP